MEVRPIALLFLGGYTAFTQFSSDIAVKGVREQKNFSPTSTLNRRPPPVNIKRKIAPFYSIGQPMTGREGRLNAAAFGTSLAS